MCTFALANQKSLCSTFRRDGRVVDYSGLENRRAERHRGFESLSLRYQKELSNFAKLLLNLDALLMISLFSFLFFRVFLKLFHFLGFLCSAPLLPLLDP